jgi:hypothetical protein
MHAFPRGQLGAVLSIKHLKPVAPVAQAADGPLDKGSLRKPQKSSQKKGMAKIRDDA